MANWLNWQICSGWAEEFCLNTWDHKSGLRESALEVFVKRKRGVDSRSDEIFPGFVNEDFGMPICNYHLEMESSRTLLARGSMSLRRLGDFLYRCADIELKRMERCTTNPI